MSSDSEHSDSILKDAILERALRNAVVHAKNLEELTINTARTAAEQELDLESGFFKSHKEWKDRSKQVITSALDDVNNGNEVTSPEPKQNSNLKSNTKPNQKPKQKPGRKRKAETQEEKRGSDKHTTQPQKRQKQIIPDDEDNSHTEGGSEPPDDEPPAKPPKRGRQSLSVLSESEDEQKPGSTSPQLTKNHPHANESESDMSDVKDEPAPPKRKRKKEASSSATANGAKSKTKAMKPNKEQDLGPDETEIKRLQGWLIKCGIRKLWHKELAPYNSPKAKIKHLKDMLKEAGMDGRYSAEKASAIKEQRELAADIEAVQEGNKKWGKDGDSEEEAVVNKRRITSRFIDFGDDDEDSE